MSDRPERDGLPSALGCLAVGVVALAAASHLSLSALRLPRHPGDGLPQIGVAATMGAASIDSGLVVRTRLLTNGCQESTPVAVLVAGDSSLWLRYHPSRADADAIVLRDGVLPARTSVARIGLALSAEDVPDAPMVAPATAEELLYGTSIEAAPTTDHRPPADLVDVTAFRRVSGFWTASATLRGWRTTHAALVVRFTARWRNDRSDGTCSYRLPSVLGPLASDATLAAEREVRATDPATSLGSGLREGLVTSPVSAAGTTFNAGDGVIDVGASAPAPDLLRDQAVSWLCRSGSSVPGTTLGTVAGTFRLYPTRDGAQPGPAPLAGTVPGGNIGCAALAVVRSGRQWRDAKLGSAAVLALLGVPALFAGSRRLGRRARRA